MSNAEVKITETQFERDLEHLLNYHGLENESDTPDFILAKYLLACLAAFNAASQERSKWHGEPKP